MGVNAGGTPSDLCLAARRWPRGFYLGGKTFEKVIAVLSFFFWQTTRSRSHDLILRKREPERPRPYRLGLSLDYRTCVFISIAFLAGAIRSDQEPASTAACLRQAIPRSFIEAAGKVKIIEQWREAT